MAIPHGVVAHLVKDRTGLAVVLSAYLILYCALILGGHGLPYVMDNNETFSSLNHAHNLWTFRFLDSFGLADEAVSPQAAAHPFAHTHQGNFPRLFAFLLYVLGARGAESQIWITTFTIGTASVVMAHTFLRRLGSDLFATIAVLVLITDYLLFAQWQVNTHRVWHGFFLFATLNCVHGLGVWQRRRWVLATLLLYFALFYWELVFAAFTAIAAATYAAWLHRRNRQLVLLAWTVQAAGAALGLGLLFVQLMLFLGWQDTLTDFRLTLTARNYASHDPRFLAELRDFYGSRGLAFFYNLQSGAPYAGALAFMRSLLRNVLQISTPLLSLVALALAAAALFSDSRRPGPRDVAVILPAVSLAATVCLVPGIFILLIAVLGGGEAVLGARWSGFAGGFGIVGLIALALLALAVALAIGLRALAAAVAISGATPGLGRSMRAGLYLAGLGLFVAVQGDLYDPAVADLWLRFFAPPPAWAGKVLVLTFAAVGSLIILAGRRATLGSWHGVPSSVAPFLVCGALAYVGVYVLSSGYLHTGYLIRLCPLPVFHVDVLLALGLFTALATARTLATAASEPHRAAARPIALAAALVGLAFVVGWASIQAMYVRRLPPDRLAFIGQLRHPSFRGQGLVTNNYAAPFGMAARTWAYGYVVRGASPEADFPFLWLADRHANPAYLRPELYVCFQTVGTLPALVRDLAGGPYTPLRCSLLDSVRRALYGSEHGGTPTAEILARDGAGDRWAIVRIDWGASASPHRKQQ